MIDLLKVQFGQFHVLLFCFNILGLDLVFGLLGSTHPLLSYTWSSSKGMKAYELAILFPEHLTRSLVSEGINARNTIITGKPLICWGVCVWGGCVFMNL